jgi:hypothetical protein
MTLSNGTEVLEYQHENGSTIAVIVPEDRAMTEAEWQEYVIYLRKLSSEQHRERLANRKIYNRMAFEAKRGF